MNPVQQKIPCVYVTLFSNEPSAKRKNQGFKVTATRNLTPKAQNHNVTLSKPTEKMDGTCCLIAEFRGVPWLWARHDRKPNKAGERKFAQFKKHQSQVDDDSKAASFSWNISKDFKEVPENWIPASRLEMKDGVALPDDNGHTPGWVPVELKSRQHCWHLSAVDLCQGVALVLRESEESPKDLVIESTPLSDLCGQTCELIGTNINGNPYGLGNKQLPIHFLIPHGSLRVDCPRPSEYDDMTEWFSSEHVDAQVEGIVWHCTNGELYKLHRHHLNLHWPVQNPRLCQRKVKVQLLIPLPELDRDVSSSKSASLFARLASVDGQEFDSLKKCLEALSQDLENSSTLQSPPSLQSGADEEHSTGADTFSNRDAFLVNHNS